MAFQARRRIAAAVVVCAMGLSPTVCAADRPEQSPSARNPADEQRRTGLYKIVAGLGAASLGAVIIAKSHQSVSVSAPYIGTIEASTTNTGGMIAGIALMGAGGVVVGLGVRDRAEAGKGAHSAVGLAVGSRPAVFVSCRW